MKKTGESVVSVVIEAEVARQVRQHSRSSMKAEICGVLIGREEGTTTLVDACIAGANAAQGGAHVTFTQDTWEHIYKVKDEKYPDARIVGWYHSHPGFGVFLSDHDLFIHKNFFSSPQQIAWVFDPHTDEEGCFGWRGEKIKKLHDVSCRYSQRCGESIAGSDEQEDVPLPGGRGEERGETLWMPLLRDAVLFIAFFLIGGAATFYYLTTRAHVIPRGGQALIIVDGDRLEVVRPDVAVRILDKLQAEMDAAKAGQPAASPAPPGTPGNAPAGKPEEHDVRKK